MTSASASRPHLRFTTPRGSVAADPTTATLTVLGAGGPFTVPYIQTSSDLSYTLAVDSGVQGPGVDVILDQGSPQRQSQRLHGPPWTGTFHGLAYGEHTLDAALRLHPDSSGHSTDDPPVTVDHLDHVARGDIVIAMGDSVTEGLRDGPFAAGVAEHLGYFPQWLAARASLAPFDAALVSGDGRNFPQAGPSTHPASRPGFEVPLARRLLSQLNHPVLVVNEGWSGITSDGFLQVADSQRFHDLVATTHPSGWLINLGANDMLTRRPAAEYGDRLGQIVSKLRELGAAAANVHLACPNFRNDPSRAGVESTYLPMVDGLRSQLGLGASPDFFSYYRDHPGERADWVHPNGAGYASMAGMWASALAGHGSKCA